MSHPTRFENLYDLAKLPWFELRGGRLVLSDPELGPIVDVHTHLALNFGPAHVDLAADQGPTEHYQPIQQPFDLDVYANKNFSEENLRRLKHDLTLQNFSKGGMRRTHTVPALGREMAELGIRQSVLLAIDFALLGHNSEEWIAATTGDERFLVFGSVPPRLPFPRRRLEKLKALGARGIKVHPNVQGVPPENARAMKIYEMCGELGLPVLFHCGPVGIESPAARARSQVYRYEAALAQTPSTTFVLGHSGALQYREAVALACKYPNTYLEVASQGLEAVRYILAEAPPDRILFGTDWPFYHQGMGLAKVLIATEGDDALRRKILHQNAARLLR